MVHLHAARRVRSISLQQSVVINGDTSGPGRAGPGQDGTRGVMNGDILPGPEQGQITGSGSRTGPRGGGIYNPVWVLKDGARGGAYVIRSWPGRTGPGGTRHRVRGWGGGTAGRVSGNTLSEPGGKMKLDRRSSLT